MRERDGREEQERGREGDRRGRQESRVQKGRLGRKGELQKNKASMTPTPPCKKGIY